MAEFLYRKKRIFLKNFLFYARKLSSAAGEPMGVRNLLEGVGPWVAAELSYVHSSSLDIDDELEKIDRKIVVKKEFFEVREWFPLKALSSSEILATFLNFLYEVIVAADYLSSKAQIQIFVQDVRFLIIFLTEMSLQSTEVEIGRDLLKNIEVVANDLGKITHVFLLDEMDEVSEEDFSLLLKEIELVKAKIEVLKLPRQRTSMNDGFVISYAHSFLQRLKHLWKIKADHLAPVKDDIKILEDGLKSLISTIKQISGQQQGQMEELKAVVAQIGGVTEEAEYVIDCFGLCPTWYLTGRLSQVLEEIQLIKVEVARNSALKAQISDKKDDNELQKGEFSEVPFQTANFKVEDVIGLQDEMELLRDLLTTGSKHLKVISIVGMAGLGKTTLAQNLYNDPYIVYHFHVRAQCTVSQSHRGRDLLLAILKPLSSTDKIGETSKMSDEDLASELYKHLKGKRYLIFMDDIWDKSAWDELRRSFPDDLQGSRVIITSRLKNVALQIEPDDRFVCEPNFLSNDECWDLLQQKAFQTKCCPPYLLEVGKHIASLCRGLPLAVVAVAGILSDTDKTETSWKEVATSLSSYIVSTSEGLMALLEKSYKHLPNHLKPCFLYCGAFPEDTEIKSRELMWLWIAEGFVPYTEEKRIEDVAEEYLKDLINRNLLIVAKRRSDEGVRACRVHDLFRDLCLRICREENFLEFIHDGSFSSSEKCPRLCSGKWSHHHHSRPLSLRVHSLLGINPFRFEENNYHIKYNPPNLRFLRVLHLLECDMDGTVPPIEIALLVSLRYLAISGNFESCASLGGLFSLEILLLRCEAGIGYDLICSQDILTLPNLRHLSVYPNFVLHEPQIMVESLLASSIQFSNLQTLSFIKIEYIYHEMILRLFPNLRKLSCNIYRENESSMTFRYPVALESLKLSGLFRHLESLKLSGFFRHIMPSELILPSSLKKLTLVKCYSRWKLMSTIGKLPNLEVLKLNYASFEGPKWDLSDEERFCKLRYLKFVDLFIEIWNIASSSSFPRLQQVCFRSCFKLAQIPSNLVDIPTLRVIEVVNCHPSATKSALEIQSEQEDNEWLKILVSQKTSDDDYEVDDEEDDDD